MKTNLPFAFAVLGIIKDLYIGWYRDRGCKYHPGSGGSPLKNFISADS